MIKMLLGVSLVLGPALLKTEASYGSFGGFPPMDEDQTTSDYEHLEEELRELMGDEMYAQFKSYGGLPPEEVQDETSMILWPETALEYNRDTHRIDYRVVNGSRYSSSVPNGMVTADPVTFLPMDNAYVIVTRNGIREELPEDGCYSREGRYHIRMLEYPGKGASADTNVYRLDFYFRIIPEVVSQLNLLHAPEEFFIERLELDGRQVQTEHREWEFLHRDGHYRVWFADKDTGNLRFQLTFTRDTTPPLLVFTPNIDRQIIKGSVSIELLDQEAGMQVYYDGTPVKLQSPQIQTGGKYLFHVRDPAGNERFYTLYLEEPVRLPGSRMIIITFIGAAGLLGFMLWQRHHMRFL